jgi:hypothetical protein
MFRHRQKLPGAWRRAAFGALSLLLLVPVPVLATYTLGTWQPINNPDGWTVSGSGLDLALTPNPDGGGVSSGTVTFVFAAPVTGSSTLASAGTSNFNAFSVSSGATNAGLQVVIGFDSTNNPAGDPSALIYKNNNQFNTGTLNPSLGVPGDYSSVTTSNFAVVKFVFTAPSGTTTTWGPTVSSSPVHITFTAGN